MKAGYFILAIFMTVSQSVYSDWEIEHPGTENAPSSNPKTYTDQEGMSERAEIILKIIIEDKWYCPTTRENGAIFG
jgi:hypothetical protein